MTRDDKRLLQAVREAVSREIRKHQLFARHESLPPPSDIDAEQDLAAAVVAGIPPSAFDLQAGDFCSRFFAEVWQAAQALEAHKLTATPERIAKAMHAAGGIGPILEEVTRLHDLTPLYHVKRLHQAAARVKEMRQRRRILAFIAKLDAALRTGQFDSAKALELLRRRCGNDDGKPGAK